MKYLKIKDLANELGISKQAVYKRINQPDCKPYLHEVDRVRCITEEGVRFAFPTRVRFETMDTEVFEEIRQSTKVENEFTDDTEKDHTAIEKTMQFQLMAHQKEVDWLRTWVDKLTDELQRERETSRQEIEQLTATIREMASGPKVDDERIRKLEERLDQPFFPQKEDPTDPRERSKRSGPDGPDNHLGYYLRDIDAKRAKERQAELEDEVARLQEALHNATRKKGIWGRLFG